MLILLLLFFFLSPAFDFSPDLTRVISKRRCSNYGTFWLPFIKLLTGTIKCLEVSAYSFATCSHQPSAAGGACSLSLPLTSLSGHSGGFGVLPYGSAGWPHTQICHCIEGRTCFILF